MRGKKFIFFILLMFIVIGSVNAETATVEYQEGIYSNRIGPDKIYSGKLGYLMIDGKIVYCLEPYEIIGSEYIVNNDYLNNYSKEDMDYFELIAGYVREKVENRNVYYYMAAQELIWERIIGDKVYWTTEKNGSTEINIQSYKNEILDFINNFYTKPSFDQTIIEDNYFNQVILEDSNNVLSEYEIIGSNDSVSRIEGNKLYVTIKSSKLEVINLKRKINEENSTYYYSQTNQDLSDLTGKVEVESTISVKANNNYSVSLSVDFLDKEYNNIPINGEIKFKIHNLDTDEYSHELVTHIGHFESDFRLECGRYEVILTSVPPNFFIPSNYEFKISENKYVSNYHIDYLLRSARGKIIINNQSENEDYKMYANENIYDIYGNLIFKKGAIVTIMEIEKDSEFFTVLPFGQYYVLDQITNKRYDFSLEYKDQYTDLVISYLDILEESIDESDDLEDPSTGDTEEKEDPEDEPNTDDREENEEPEEDPSTGDTEEKEEPEDEPNTDDREENEELEEDPSTGDTEEKEGLEDEPNTDDREENEEPEEDPSTGDTEEKEEPEDEPNTDDREENEKLEEDPSTGDIEEKEEPEDESNTNDREENEELETESNIKEMMNKNQTINSTNTKEILSGDIKTLPNTYNYIGKIKCILILWVMINTLIKKYVENE